MIRKSRKPTELKAMILSVLSDLPTGSQPLDLKQEQQIDEVIGEVILWKNGGSPDQSPIFPIALRRYRKQFGRLVVDDILYRLFYDAC